MLGAMKILIASGIYPPDIGGPAQYARNLYETWRDERVNSGEPTNGKQKNGKAKSGELKNEVKIAAYRWERAFPPVIRHILFFLKIIRKGWNADLILVLDTWSAAVPAMFACRLMRKRYLIRTGGDFLWETYVERTGDMVLFKDFYPTRIPKLSRKEKVIFKLGGSALRKAAAIIFSTDWQRRIFEKAYGLNPEKDHIIENYCGPREAFAEPENRAFIAATRTLKWKNVESLRKAFAVAHEKVRAAGLPDIELDVGKAVYDSFVEKIRHSYAVILASLGDISPNMVFDAVRAGTPFILTKETGILERVGDCAITVDPLNRKDIVEKIVWLSDPKNRAAQAEKVRKFAFTHTWEQIADEIERVWKKSAKKNRRRRGRAI